MRLTTDQLMLIRSTVAEQFGNSAQVWLFGSRVNDNSKGGDIDLYIEPVETDIDKLVEAKLKFLMTLHKTLGDQNIDVVIRTTSPTDELPIYNIAKKTGCVSRERSLPCNISRNSLWNTDF